MPVVVILMGEGEIKISVNYYFQSGIPEDYTPNQRLIESLIIQAIQINGMEMYYLPRTLVDVDHILTEDELAKFDNAYRLEMYMDNVQGFEGDGALMTKFGIDIADSCTFVLARLRWEQEVGRTGTTTLNRPMEGDIVYLPITKSFFEIKRVVAANPFFQLGKLFVYRLECELFQFGQERFDTGVPEIDTFANLISLSDEEHVLTAQDKSILTTEEGGEILLDFRTEDVDRGAQNETFRDNNDVFDFSEHNPFAEVDH